MGGVIFDIGESRKYRGVVSSYIRNIDTHVHVVSVDIGNIKIHVHIVSFDRLDLLELEQAEPIESFFLNQPACLSLSQSRLGSRPLEVLGEVTVLWLARWSNHAPGSSDDVYVTLKASKSLSLEDASFQPAPMLQGNNGELD